MITEYKYVLEVYIFFSYLEEYTFRVAAGEKAFSWLTNALVYRQMNFQQVGREVSRGKHSPRPRVVLCWNEQRRFGPRGQVIKGGQIAQRVFRPVLITGEGGMVRKDFVAVE